MKGSMNTQVMNEFQELVIDPKWLLLESKGSLFRYKSIGGELAKGGKLEAILGKFWTESVQLVCRDSLDSGKTGSVVVEDFHNGGKISLLFVSVPQVKSDRIRGIVLTIHDITISRRLERYQILREKMKIIAHLASQIVHNMNNPIAAVLNAIGGLLVEDIEKIDPQRLRKELQEIQEQLYGMAIVTNALTAFSIDNKQDYKLIQANHVIEHTLNLLKLIFSQEKIQYQIQLDENLPRIMGNEVTIEQALVNVCRNAVEAMPDGGTLSITAKVDDQFKDFVCISISDDGVGIPEEHLELVFEPFYTTKGQGRKGLGLTVCYGIISNHNGNIEISSRLGSGTTIQIVLPIAKI